MIRKLLVGAGVSGVVIAAAVALDAGHLSTYVNKLNAAEGLEVSYSIAEVGGTQAKYSVTLGKPNMAMIDTPEKTYVADGENLTVYDKKMNSYYVKAQPENVFKDLFAEEDLLLWRAFFDKKAFDNVAATKNEGTRTRRGETLSTLVAQVDKSGEYTIKLHVSAKDNLVRQAEFISTVSGLSKIRVMNVESINTNKPADSKFVFNAPAGSKQLTEAEMSAAEWGYDFNKALESAAALGKGVIIDFYADW